ncbi:GntR family transcriptional regulator [Acuticoccus sp.]|uniref:GntR family transcriptional regulator n=1 Tax=Acuticoccus sp. TaxID=1904378 RepID=UPI003B51F42E
MTLLRLVHQCAEMLQTIELERDRAYRELRSLVVGGAFAYDEALSERALAARFGLSRTPMREAVRRLVTEGLLTSLPARGVFVRRMDERELTELYEVRLAVEGMAARLAAAKASKDDVSTMRATMALVDQGSDVQTIQDVGWTFHRQIFSAAGNAQLAAIYESIVNRIIVAMRMTLRHDPARVRRTVAEHLAIFRAIEARNAAGAELAMREHLTGALTSRLSIADTLSDPPSGSHPYQTVEPIGE